MVFLRERRELVKGTGVGVVVSLVIREGFDFGEGGFKVGKRREGVGGVDDGSVDGR